MNSPLKSKDDVDQFLSVREQYKFDCLELEDGQSITILINGDVGWLMYLREPGDIGFSTRNPEFADAVGVIEYVLNNGQRDEHPASWAYPVATLRSALHQFVDTHRLPESVSWHDDSLDDSR